MAVGTTTLLLAGGGMSAAASAIGGEVQAKSIQRQAEHNATIYEQQAEMVKQKKKISEYKFNRQFGQMVGSTVAATAGKGLTLSGSPMAILIDNESQMLFDKAIQDYNFDIERNYALSAAENTRQQGAMDARAKRFEGYSNAFSQILSTGANIGMMNLGSGGAGYGKSGLTRQQRINQMNVFKAGRYGAV